MLAEDVPPFVRFMGASLATNQVGRLWAISPNPAGLGCPTERNISPSHSFFST